MRSNNNAYIHTAGLAGLLKRPRSRLADAAGEAAVLAPALEVEARNTSQANVMYARIC